MAYAVIRCVNGAFAIHAEFSGNKRADGTPWTDAEKKIPYFDGESASDVVDIVKDIIDYEVRYANEYLAD